MLTVKDISFGYQRTLLLQGVSCRVGAGEMVALVGPNGAGKSTLLKLLAGLLTPSRGEIWLQGQPLHRWGLVQRAQKIGYLAQQGEIAWGVSVEQLVALGRYPYGGSMQSVRAAAPFIERVLAECDLLPLRKRRADTLSGGERARLLLARVLVGEPQLLLVDEPVAALDLAHQLQLMQQLERFCQQGGALLLVVHNLQLAAHFSSKVVLLQQGKLVAEGEAAKVLTPERMAQLFGVVPNPELQGRSLQLPWLLPRTMVER
ncbi:ABC transporter ATP-binding protein [Ectothiorhodospiraceae bacterium BW-2]|nr:ABC transporter ATP-binding protein [Ectothiorhodospiraceae bacterium BW-2]